MVGGYYDSAITPYDGMTAEESIFWTENLGTDHWTATLDAVKVGDVDISSSSSRIMFDSGFSYSYASK